MRDFVGYGQNPPHARWPGEARIALQFAINYEEGAECSVADGDPRNEVGLTEAIGGRVPAGQRDLAFESLYEYGSRVGIWRLLDLFRQRSIPVTMFGCALAFERNPAVAVAVRDAGYDVCCHGWRWIEPFRLSEAEEREHIARAVQSFERTTGQRPLGWYSRFGPSEHTRRLLVEEGGFLYDADAYNDELPYWTTVAGRQHLVVPYSMDANDAKFAPPASFATGEDFFSYLKETFDMLYAEGDTAPRIMSVGLHPRMSGRPARALGLARFVDYARGHDQVWFCRRIDIARHWQSQHPASPTVSLTPSLTV
ncbi:MAG: polysaccharide deacetylase family protein [Betaproteobacteria bacterium]